MVEEMINNQAFIDGQNLHLGTTTSTIPWKVDLYRFREYLRKKYHVIKAYYFLGCFDINNQELYNIIQDAGFILVFRAHSESQLSSKKGNVDTDIVFSIMKEFHEHEDIAEFYLVSGDGDYYKTIKYLYDKGKLGKVLFPAHHKASSLYKQLDNSCYDYLDNEGVRKKIKLIEK